MCMGTLRRQWPSKVRKKIEINQEKLILRKGSSFYLLLYVSSLLVYMPQLVLGLVSGDRG
jgi:hypothetical protein